MGSGRQLNKDQVRAKLKKETALVVIGAMSAQWRVRALGHGVKILCPCGEHSLSVGGTPTDDGREAKRVARFIRICQPTD